jgi:hypothetical protein
LTSTGLSSEARSSNQQESSGSDNARNSSKPPGRQSRKRQHSSFAESLLTDIKVDSSSTSNSEVRSNSLRNTSNSSGSEDTAGDLNERVMRSPRKRQRKEGTAAAGDLVDSYVMEMGSGPEANSSTCYLQEASTSTSSFGGADNEGGSGSNNKQHDSSSTFRS